MNMNFLDFLNKKKTNAILTESLSILEVLKEYDLDLTVRAENLTIEQFIEISNKLNEK